MCDVVDIVVGVDCNYVGVVGNCADVKYVVKCSVVDGDVGIGDGGVVGVDDIVLLLLLSLMLV